MSSLVLLANAFWSEINYANAFCTNQYNRALFLQTKHALFRKYERQTSLGKYHQRLFLTDSDDDNESGNNDNESGNNDNDDDYETSKWISVINQNDWEADFDDTPTSPSWSSFESDDSDEVSSTIESPVDDDETLDDGEAWLDVIQGISADEIEFMNTENERAFKVQEMQEWGFSSDEIENALGVATNDVLDSDDSVLEEFREVERETEFVELDPEIDLEDIESHTTVERDEDTNEVIRLQNVYVDEVSCIGCTNCANIAQSTFFMEQEHGRARVFRQWGDDDETIAIAIDTCPVDCIHYIPYEELEKLETERREQNINFAARLMGESSGLVNSYGGAKPYSTAQKISGNMGSRCNNCPNRGCKDCPMYGVGKNPAFQEQDQKRLDRLEAKKRKSTMENLNKSVDL